MARVRQLRDKRANLIEQMRRLTEDADECGEARLSREDDSRFKDLCDELDNTRVAIMEAERDEERSRNTANAAGIGRQRFAHEAERFRQRRGWRSAPPPQHPPAAGRGSRRPE
jgi:hypothetical protein